MTPATSTVSKDRGRGPASGPGLVLVGVWMAGRRGWRGGGARPEKRVRKEAGVGMGPGLGGVLRSGLLLGLVRWAVLGPRKRRGPGWRGQSRGSKVGSGAVASLEPPRWWGWDPAWGRGLSPTRECGGGLQASSGGAGGRDLRSGPLPAVMAHPPILSPLRQVSSREFL